MTETPTSPTPDAGKRRPQPEDIPGVLEAIGDGLSLRKACEERGLHPGHTHALIESDDGFRAQYARAKHQRGEFFQEKALELGFAAATGQNFDGHKVDPRGAQIALDAIKWSVARMDPKSTPVQRIDLTSRTRQMTDDEIAAEIAALERAAATED